MKFAFNANQFTSDWLGERLHVCRLRWRKPSSRTCEWKV